MDIEYRTVLKFLRDEPSLKSAEEFAQMFRRNRDETTWYFNFREKQEFIAAIAHVDGTSLKLPYHYKFTFTLEEIDRFPGFSFQVDAIEDLFTGGKVQTGKMKGKSLACDFRTNDIFANAKGKEAIDSGSKEVSWRDFQGTAGGNYHRLTVRTEMKDPMKIPHAREVSESVYRRGFFQVMDDGLAIITDEGATQLEEFGLLISMSFEAEGKIYPRQPVRMISGKLYGNLLKKKIAGITNDFSPLFKRSQLEEFGLLP